jgi:hypothetical protein
MAVSNIEIRSAADLRIDPRRKTRRPGDEVLLHRPPPSRPSSVTVAIIATLLVDAIAVPPGPQRHRGGPRRALSRSGGFHVAWHLRHRHARGRHVHRHRDRDDRCDPAGPRRRDLPRPSTPAPRSARPSSPFSRSSPASRASCSATSPSPTSTRTSSPICSPAPMRRSRSRPPASASGSSPSRSSPRSPRTRCRRCLSHFARRPTVSARIDGSRRSRSCSPPPSPASSPP